MKPPAFWYRPPGLWSTLLSPLGALYASGTARRLAQGAGVRPAVPVICVGNLNVGGTGKTPTTIALLERLTQRGRAPHVVTRGYGGRLEGPVKVDPSAHTAGETGDEPLLLAAFGPTWVAKDRAAGARAAEAGGAEVILLDDGFQNPAVQKDLSILVVDAARGFGNEKVLPAGPLREPLEVGLKRAGFVLSIGPEDAQSAFKDRWGSRLGVPHLTGALSPLATGQDWQGQRVFAFAGIGHPEKFFATLKGQGVELAAAEALDDHQPLTPALLTRLQRDARALGAQLVTTEKDAVRLPAQFQREVLTLPVRLSLDDWGPLDAALDRLFDARP